MQNDRLEDEKRRTRGDVDFETTFLSHLQDETLGNGRQQKKQKTAQVTKILRAINDCGFARVDAGAEKEPGNDKVVDTSPMMSSPTGSTALSKQVEENSSSDNDHSY